MRIYARAINQVTLLFLPLRYSQSPVSMKAVSASMWLLTVSAGNFIIMIIAETKFFERAGEVREFARMFQCVFNDCTT